MFVARDHGDVDPVELLLVVAAGDVYLARDHLARGERFRAEARVHLDPADTDAAHQLPEHDSSSRKLFPEPIFSR
jgi:hypothetical protein